MTTETDIGPVLQANGLDIFIDPLSNQGISFIEQMKYVTGDDVERLLNYMKPRPILALCARFREFAQQQRASQQGGGEQEIAELHRRVDELQERIKQQQEIGFLAGLQAPSVVVSRGTREKCVQKPRKFFPSLFENVPLYENDSWRSVWDDDWTGEHESYDDLEQLLNGLGVLPRVTKRDKETDKSKYCNLNLYTWFGIGSIEGLPPDLNCKNGDDLVGISFEIKLREAMLNNRCDSRASINLRPKRTHGTWEDMATAIRQQLPNPYRLTHGGTLNGVTVRSERSWMEAENQVILLLMKETPLPPVVFLTSLEPDEGTLVVWVSLEEEEDATDDDDDEKMTSTRIPFITCSTIKFKQIPALLHDLVDQNYSAFGDVPPVKASDLLDSGTAV